MAIRSGITRGDVTADGVLMLSLGAILFSLEPLMVNPATELNGYRAAVFLTAAALLFGWIHFTRMMRGTSTRVRLTYGLIAELLIGCWIALWIIQSSPLDLRLLLLLGGAHAILWGLWLLKLAIQVQRLPIRAAGVSLLAAGSAAAGIAIAVESDLTRTTALNLLACYSMYIGLVLVSVELCLYRALPSKDISVAREVQKERQDEVHPVVT